MKAARSDLEPPPTARQHARLKSAHPHYEWRQALNEQAAGRNPLRCICMVDPDSQVAVIEHLTTAEQVGVVVVFMDSAGAHMHPECSHSDLWRCTRPMAAITKWYYRKGQWPDDLRPFLANGNH